MNIQAIKFLNVTNAPRTFVNANTQQTANIRGLADVETTDAKTGKRVTKNLSLTDAEASAVYAFALELLKKREGEAA